MGFHLDQFIFQALEEDITDPSGTIPAGDHSSKAVFSDHPNGSAKMLIKQDGVLAGVEVGLRVFELVDDSLQVDVLIDDGSAVKTGDVVLHVYGAVQSILRAERVVLNIMQRMSGIASLTHQFVKAVEDTGVTILDTRKTTPGLRFLEKWAVELGGGNNHRFGLYDMIMLKDNHIDYAGGIIPALEKTHTYLTQNNLSLRIEVEARTVEDVKLIVESGLAHRVMFDNFTHEMAREAASIAKGKIETEISGGVNLNTVRSYAETGVDFISIGALTHSAPALDISLKAVVK
jgi:nicotinate-nucleotide pyrophosphorylase (carboxylating)